MEKLIDAHHRQTLENISDGRLKLQAEKDAVARRTRNEHFFSLKLHHLQCVVDAMFLIAMTVDDDCAL